MKRKIIKTLEKREFCQLIGIEYSTFEEMEKLLEKADQERKDKGGRNSKLRIEDRLRMVLAYKHECSTYILIGQIYRVSQSTAYRIIKWVEDVLIKKHFNFSLFDRQSILKRRKLLGQLTTVKPILLKKKNQSGRNPIYC